MHNDCVYIEQLCALRVTVSLLLIDRNKEVSSNKFQRRARVEEFISFSRRRLIVVSCYWFSEFFNPTMGTIHDCYIPDFETRKQEMIISASFSRLGSIDENIFHSERNQNNFKNTGNCRSCIATCV